MSEFWVSKKKYWCTYCETFIADDKPSRTQHESGLRHQGNKERYVRQIYKTGEKRKRDAEEEKREMAAIDRAASAAYAEDISSGRGGTASTSAAAKPRPSANATTSKPTSKWSNYTTAASLGYVDEDAIRSAAWTEQRQKEGTVGAWEVVVPPPPPLPMGEEQNEGEDRKPNLDDEADVDVKPIKPPPATLPDYNPDDPRSFRVKTRTLESDDLYDPGEIIVKKKVQVEEESKVEGGPTIALPDENSRGGGWQQVDLANPSVVPPNDIDEASDPPIDTTTPPEPSGDTDHLGKDVMGVKEEDSKEKLKLEEPEAIIPTGGSLFKKRRRPTTAVSKRERF